MGNYCSSTKKDKDNISDKSEEWVPIFILLSLLSNIPVAALRKVWNIFIMFLW